MAACTRAARWAHHHAAGRRALSGGDPRLRGTAFLIFQPAEEGGGGGQVMVKEGLFERFPANEVYALHNWPGLPPGKLAVRAGPVMAATDEIEIIVRGRGGHAAMPHLVIDPVVAASHIITALQTIGAETSVPWTRWW